MTAVCEPPVSARLYRASVDGTTESRPAGVAGEIEAWVAPAARGDRHATERLLSLLRPAVLRYCHARVSAQEASAATVDDIAQEVLIAVLGALPHYRQEERRLFLGFVYGIASHKIADARRCAARNRVHPAEPVPDVADGRPGPEDLAITAQQRAHVGSLLSSLSDIHREILFCRVVMGLSASDTAAALGSTPGAVRVAQHRALRKLRAIIAGPREDISAETV